MSKYVVMPPCRRIDKRHLIQNLGALKNQVQHFSEKMLHGKNIQAVEC